MKAELRMIAPHRIPIITKSGNVAGTVGPRATTATVSRFLGHPRARLGEYQGRRAWIEQGQNGRFSKRAQPESFARRHARGSVKAPGR